jgi:hypothetical protein
MQPVFVQSVTYPEDALLDRWSVLGPGDVSYSLAAEADEVVDHGGATCKVVHDVYDIATVVRGAVDIDARDIRQCRYRRRFPLVVANNKKPVDVTLAQHESEIGKPFDDPSRIGDNRREFPLL